MELILPIIGNNGYLLEVDKNKITVNVAASYVEIPEQNKNYVKLSLYNLPEKWYNKQWLALVSMYNLRPPQGYEHAINYFRFKKFQPLYKSVDMHMVVFSSPVQHKTLSNYRMIARYPNYFISNTGDVYNETSEKHISPSKANNIYQRVSLRDQSGLAVYASCTVHRLVAMTWVKNDDYVTKPIIDHMDGNKHNNSMWNLRWVSYKDNALYSFEQNLKSYNMPVVSKNIETGEIAEHRSIREAFKYIGKNRSGYTSDILSESKVVTGDNGVFELSIKDNLKDNHNEEKQDVGKDTYKTMYNTSVIDITIDGETKRYNNWREVKVKVLGVDPKFSYTIPMIIQKIKNKYPEAVITYKTIKGVIGTYNGKRIEANSMQEMADKTGLPKSTITLYSKTGDSLNGWVFKRRYVDAVYK